MAEINWLALFRGKIALYFQNHIKSTNKLCVQNAALLMEFIK
jgi:hypothetical protein